MQSLARIEAATLARPSIFARNAFSAWRISPDNPRHEARPLEIPADMPDLPELAKRLAVHCQHKDRFAIRVVDAVTGKGVVHFYAIKRESKAVWRRNPVTGEHSCIAQLYPVHEFSVAISDFVPVEPFVATPGCDVVGYDKGAIQA